ncbi:MAG: hypothetical protein K8Q89_10330 [Nitrosarchaeum sp.]|nr:hypothetical protein [Nitrosarchaeum sp.]
MKIDSRIIISIDKQFYSEEDEIRIHVWFNMKSHSMAALTVFSQTGKIVDSALLKKGSDNTETFALTCGGPNMCENGYYVIKVECDYVVSEAMFEYYSSRNPPRMNEK